jgi:hypothetical protein
VWVLGDDDAASPDAIAVALAAIAAHPEAVVINFSTRGSFERSHERSSRGRAGFLEELDDFGNALFVSSSLFNAARLRKHLDHGHQFAYSCAPHLAMLLMALGEDGLAVFSPRALVHWERPQTENRGSLITIALGLPVLLELPMPQRERRALALSSHAFRGSRR